MEVGKAAVWHRGGSDAAPPEGRGEQLRGDTDQPPATGTGRQDRVNTGSDDPAVRCLLKPPEAPPPRVVAPAHFPQVIIPEKSEKGSCCLFPVSVESLLAVSVCDEG